MSSSSAARLSDAASTDPLAGIEPANDAYGSLASLASRPKPKKKPVLVLDADELAAAHELFQQGAAEQLEDADHIERAPVTLGLAPLGSDMEADDTPDEDEDDYGVEADAPSPDDVLNLTRSDAPEAPKPRKNPNKTMVALPPDGAPELDDIEPFVPLAPVDAEDGAEDGEEPQGDLAENSSAFAEEPAQDDAPASAPEAEPAFDLNDESNITHRVEDVPAPVAAAQDHAGDGPRITRIEEEEIDGSAFMRAPERYKADINNAGGPTSQNSLRARLVRETEIEVEEEPEGLWQRFTAWIGKLWSRFLG